MIPSLFLEPGFLEGWVRHQRHQPRPHDFKIKKTWVCIDVDELQSFGEGLKYWHLNTIGLHSLSRSAFIGHPGESIRAAVQRQCQHYDIDVGLGQILAIVACKNLSLGINPAEFYLVHDEDANIIAIIAHLKNTQGESYPYTFKVQDQNNLHFECQKALYVASHTPMDVLYKWHFYIGKRHFMVHMRTEKIPDPDEPKLNALLFAAKVKRDAQDKILMDVTMSTTLRPFSLENSKKLGIKYMFTSFSHFISRIWNRLILNENGIGEKHPAHRQEEHPRDIPPPTPIRKSRRRL